MIDHTPKRRIRVLMRVLFAACLVFLLLLENGQDIMASSANRFTNHVIFTAPSAEKIFDGTPLTEQIDVTVQGLPEGFSYKAVAEGSVTFPEDNSEDNNIVTDYIIFDPNGLDVTDKFVNVEVRPGTLRVSYPESEVLGAHRDADSVKEPCREEDTTIEIVDEKTPLAPVIHDEKARTGKKGTSIEVITYGILFVIMIVVFAVFIFDSNKLRVK